jgi:hypothetical protein
LDHRDTQREHQGEMPDLVDHPAVLEASCIRAIIAEVSRDPKPAGVAASRL